MAISLSPNARRAAAILPAGQAPAAMTELPPELPRKSSAQSPRPTAPSCVNTSTTVLVNEAKDPSENR